MRPVGVRATPPYIPAGSADGPPVGSARFPTETHPLDKLLIDPLASCLSYFPRQNFAYLPVAPRSFTFSRQWLVELDNHGATLS